MVTNYYLTVLICILFKFCLGENDIILKEIEERARNLSLNFENILSMSSKYSSESGHNSQHLGQHFIFKMPGLLPKPPKIFDSIKHNLNSLLHPEHSNMSLFANTSDLHWEKYKEQFNKSYLNYDEEMVARDAWSDNIKMISDHNRALLAGKHSYSLEINPLTDLSFSSFLKNILRLAEGLTPEHKQTHRGGVAHLSRNFNLPETVDWRLKGYRPRMERQLHCGSCYAFTVAHALQAQLFKKHGDWRDLSPQQIVDCSSAYGNYGCNGGSLRATLKYLKTEGLEYEDDYRYHAKVGTCHKDPFLKKVRPRHWAMIKKGDEEYLAKAVATIGPVAVSIDASRRTFQLYRAGIYDDFLCSNRVPNHAVLVVGYNKNYWIIMNWWGQKWGENGYMRIRRGVNKCGIANIAAYVEI